jgi:hypothetical protein
MLFSCEEDNDVTVPPIEETLFIRGELKGHSFELTGPHVVSGSGSISSASPIAFKSFSSHHQFDNMRIEIHFGRAIHKNAFSEYSGDDQDTQCIDSKFKSENDFRSLFTTGTKSYLPFSTEKIQDTQSLGVFVKVIFFPEGQPFEEWTSYKNPTHITHNSDFLVIESRKFDPLSEKTLYLDPNRPVELVKGKFSCWIYNYNASDSIQMKNYEFLNFFQEWYTE